MDVREAVKAACRFAGYDGLFTDGCGCDLDELMPCDTPKPTCEMGYKKTHSVNGMWIITDSNLRMTDEQILRIVNDA